MSAALPLDLVDLPADAVEVGRIADAWGVKGWFKVLPYSAAPEALFSSKRWYLQPAERGMRGFEGTRLLRIREAKEHADTIVAWAQDIPDRGAAEALRGARVFVPRSSFPSIGADEYYWVDLIGLAVVNREGVELGEVRELLSTGPQTVLVLSYRQEGKALGACRTLGVESENVPQRGQFLPDSQPHSGAMGQEAGKKWAAAAHSQPTIPKSDRLLERMIPFVAAYVDRVDLAARRIFVDWQPDY
jgi:16S rRNA processing protein RimM